MVSHGLTDPPPRERPTVRVLLLDAQDRLLLMKARPSPDHPGPAAWFTVGGEVEPGETLAEAAAREIVEETGIRDAVLGQVVWLREGVLELAAGEARLMKESYLVARCAGQAPSREGWTPLERAVVEDMAWWTREALLATAEPVYPPGLADRLEDIVAGRYPPEAVSIPWRP